MKTLLVIALMFSSSLAFAKGNAAAGKAKVATCTACHGANGVSTNNLWPNLKGQKAGYLAKQIRDFKAGKRKDPVMSAQAKTISDADIDNIAAYYASLK